jgi:hypothetical protein
MKPTPVAAQEAFKHLMALPLDVERPKLHVLLPYAPKTLSRLSRKFLTPRAPEFGPNPVPLDKRPVPSYADWLRAAMRPRVLRADPPKIPEGEWADVRAYVAAFDRANSFRSLA